MVDAGNPLVSIIINCRNGEKFVNETISSVLSQTYQNWELIFWDNRSIDATASIVQSFHEPRIKYFLAEKSTKLGEARNLALNECSGKFIAFLDSDDSWKENKLEVTLQKFDSSFVGMVYTNGYIKNQQNGFLRAFYKNTQPTGNLFLTFLSKYNVMLCSVVFKREVLDDMQVWFDPDFEFIEEYDFFTRVSKKWGIGYSHEKTCIWRMHPDSLTWSKNHLFEYENRIFFSKFINENNNLIGTLPILKFQAKIAYQYFYNKWEQDGICDNGALLPYVMIDKRICIVILISLFGKRFFDFILKKTGKKI